MVETTWQLEGDEKNHSIECFSWSNDVAVLVETLEPLVLGVHGRTEPHLVLEHTFPFLHLQPNIVGGQGNFLPSFSLPDDGRLDLHFVQLSGGLTSG